MLLIANDSWCCLCIVLYCTVYTIYYSIYNRQSSVFFTGKLLLPPFPLRLSKQDNRRTDGRIDSFALTADYSVSLFSLSFEVQLSDLHPRPPSALHIEAPFHQGLSMIMAHRFHNEPLAENYQQAAYNGFPFLPEFGHRRTAPREEPFIHHRANGIAGQGPGWYQGGHKFPKGSFRSKKYWVRPIDGARHGALGRLKDALTGEGPDVFVVANGDRRTFMRDVPSRNHWSGWDKTGLRWVGDANWRGASEDMDWYPKTNYHAPWARREKDQVYNFRTREYDDLKGSNRLGFWSDAHYSQGQRGKYSIPTAWRMWDGKWHTTVDPSAGRWPGGRPLR